MGKKILLADDSITIQKVIELTFSDEDFEVVTVSNGRLAVERIQEVRPDVVLCDVIMPEKDGYEVCEFIKKTPGLAQTPVLLLTGAFEPFDQERAARVGCDGFLAKPFEPETLIARVKDLLAKAARPATAASRTGAVQPPIAEAAARPPSPSVPLPPVAPPSPPPAFAPPPPVAFTPPPPPAAPEPEMAFIPDEPFEDLDAPPYAAATAPPMAAPVAPAAVAPPPQAPAPESVEELLPISSEESESLAGSGEDGTSTLMFRADSLPWNTRTAPPAPAPPPHVETPAVSPAPRSGTSEMPIFEEVIEEAEVQVSTVLMSEPSAFEPLPPARAPTFAAVPLAPPTYTPPPVVAAAAPRPPAPPAPTPMAARESFADVAADLREAQVEPAPNPPSVAASVDVPVDMVSQIAQRVVAQVSEKVVERIAWEVVPDLAEALIKREIERLKAELQQLG